MYKCISRSNINVIRFVFYTFFLIQGLLFMYFQTETNF